ncbi:MAG: DoxX family protein [Tessaracoccus sp.]|uniref:DoxX family protein n=1 Tax=Tessaracoccus sp. TaxID=1971211 RepID=UPI001ECF70FA|nr:DoxX family protein [Tessaracoccus sp.]MBK7820063.1 DoxX family protein [Tessaracoccus sp.]
MKAFLRVVQDIALLVARLVAALVLIAHGWHRWQVAGIDSQITIVQGAGLPIGFGIVVVTIAFELIGGTLLAFGLGTRLIGLGMAAMNGVIVFVVRWDNGLYLNDGGWEYNAVLGVLGLLFLAHGSGRLGVDHLFVRPPGDGSDLIDDGSDKN